MKKFLLTLLLILGTTWMYSQDISKINSNTYKVEINQSEIKQVGYFKIQDNQSLRHGIWKMWRDDKLIMTGIYRNGKLIQFTLAKSNRTITIKDLEIMKLRHKVNRLEKLITSKD